MSKFNNIRSFWKCRLAVYALWVCLNPLQVSAEVPHTDDLGLPSSRLEAEQGPVAGRCGVDPRRLASFANGENYDYANLVSFFEHAELYPSGCTGQSGGRAIRRKF